MASAEPAVPPALDVEVVWSPAPRQTRGARLRLPAGATVGDALQAAGWPELQAALAAPGSDLVLAVWGRVCRPVQALRDGDRVEVLRPLRLAPNEARRLRYEAAGGVKALRRQRQALQPKKGRPGA